MFEGDPPMFSGGSSAHGGFMMDVRPTIGYTRMVKVKSFPSNLKEFCEAMIEKVQNPGGLILWGQCREVELR